MFGFLPLIFFVYEYLFLHCPDELWFRKPLPPKLDYPNPFTVPDTIRVEYAKTDEFKVWQDAGVAVEPGLKIVDGEKVYDKFTGVNKPKKFI